MSAKFLEWLCRHKTIGAIAVGGMLGSPFLSVYLIPFGYFGLVALWCLLKRLTLAELITYLPIVFGLKAACAIVWFWNTLPIDWLPELSLFTQTVAVLLYWVSSAVWLSSAGIFLAIWWRWHARISTVLLPLYVGIGFVLSEYLAAVVFSILTIGPGAYVSGAFSFGHIGYTFPWLHDIARWGGVYMVGIFGITLIITVFEYGRTRDYRYLLSLVVLLVILASAHVSSPTRDLPYTIALIQTSFRGESLSDGSQKRRDTLDIVMAEALATNPDYILLPEDARYIQTNYYGREAGVDNAVAAWRMLQGNPEVIVVDSGRTVDADTNRVVQRAYLWGSSSPIYTADKTYLVPQGEYMPTLYAFFLRLLGLGVVADNLGAIINYTSSERRIDVGAAPEVPGLLFCFESVDPLAAVRLIRHRPVDFIVHPMSHTWFHTPDILWRQLEIMLRFQAVYAGVPIVSVGNEVRGQVYWPDGTVSVPKTVSSSTFGVVDIVAPH
jgi:apolipoprotein N-acyltransferase